MSKSPDKTPQAGNGDSKVVTVVQRDYSPANAYARGLENLQKIADEISHLGPNKRVEGEDYRAFKVRQSALQAKELAYEGGMRRLDEMYRTSERTISDMRNSANRMRLRHEQKLHDQNLLEEKKLSAQRIAAAKAEAAEKKKECDLRVATAKAETEEQKKKVQLEVNAAAAIQKNLTVEEKKRQDNQLAFATKMAKLRVQKKKKNRPTPYSRPTSAGTSSSSQPVFKVRTPDGISMSEHLRMLRYHTMDRVRKTMHLVLNRLLNGRRWANFPDNDTFDARALVLATDLFTSGSRGAANITEIPADIICRHERERFVKNIRSASMAYARGRLRWGARSSRLSTDGGGRYRFQ